ncbi:prepilin peptidase [Leuconostoc gelidum]|uniref:prepilin peptidase n=1 Tax=Leuconostoc gelidum TaxID=1244 RepID=UPI00030434DE|nr:A24 family peptidase [Leuconostoc gelidum]MBZ5992810.1 prepilin peptidase [Leuconostoc gelidum subsp. gelidum]USP17513.1 prepilin peptidase [Leuconostoc gelidum subsp. aenigmaticum]
MEKLLIIILNAVLVSTIMCLADRVNNHIHIFIKRSYCMHCGHILHWYDLIPILSALLTHARCRYCHRTYGMHYAYFELVGMLVGSYLFSDTLAWITAYLLLFLALEDWHTERIHADILIPYIVYLFIHSWSDPKILTTCTVMIISLFLVYYRQAMGSGDIPVLLLITLTTTAQSFPLTLLLASISALLYLVKHHVQRLPFVPFLYFGWLSIILIEKIVTSMTS